MPSKPYSGSIGYSLYPSPQPDATETRPGFASTLGAAWRVENSVANFVELMNKPTFEPEPDFNLVNTLKTSGMFDNYRDNFLGVQSSGEFNYVAARVKREEKDRDTLIQAGWLGVGAAMLMGVLDPTMFLPLTAGAKGLKAVAEGSALGMAAAGAQETVLFANQELRTPAEAAVGVGTATVLGGILGGAVQYFTKDAVRETARQTDALMNSTSYQSLSAAAARQEVGGLKTATGTEFLNDQLSRIGPVTSTINQETSPQARWMMQQMADAGLRMKGNVEGIPTSLGGTVEDRVKVWHGPVKSIVDEIDRAYQDYWFGDAAPRLLGNLRANAGGYMLSGGKLTKQEFKEDISRAMFSGDVSDNKQAQKVAEHIRKTLFDPLFEEAKRVKLMSESAEQTQDISYLHRDYNNDMIERRFDEFVKILGDNFSKKLGQEFNERLAKMREAEAKDTSRAEAINMPEDVAQARADVIREELKQITPPKGEGPPTAESSNLFRLFEMQDEIADLRQQARDAPTFSLRAQFRKAAAAVKEKGGERLAALEQAQALARRTLRDLTRNRYTMDAKLEAKLDKIERLEDASLGTLERLVRKGYKLLGQIAKMSDKELDKQLEGLKKQVVAAQKSLVTSEKRLGKVIGEGDKDKALAAMGQVKERDALLKELALKLRDTSEVDREELRGVVEELLAEATSRANEINAKRAERIARLREQAKQFEPSVVEAELKRLEGRKEGRRAKVAETTRTVGANDLDLETGQVDFQEFAKSIAEETAHKILGTELRLAGIDILQQARGAELARVLDIPSKEIYDFLNLDIESVVRKHVRTLAPDIELTEKFGSPNAVEEFKKLTDEYNRAVDAVAAEGPKKGETPEAYQRRKDKRIGKLTKEYTTLRRNLEATIGRLRHQWGIPTNPRGYAHRAARVAMNLNVARLMGGVTISSIADVARPIQKYGLLNTFRDGFVPLVTNLKTIRMSQKEAQLAGTALDVVLHSRAHQMFDVMDEFGRGSKAERLLEYATSRIGLLGVFDYWTSGMKQFTAGIVNAQLMRAIEGVNTGKATAKQIEQLASTGIDGPMAERIWKQVQSSEGGGQVNGIWLPNTESWDDQVAVRAYRAALVGEIDDTIITPGLERPLWVDANTVGRMVAQFRSFALSSTTKTVMAGLQQRDLAFVNGTMLSLGLGALSYWLWAQFTGGDAYTEMTNAGPDKWADEAIIRSGNLGAFSEAQRIFETIPLTQPYATFSGTRSSRREGGDFVGALAGPTLDLAERGGNVLMGIDQPTQSTLHQFRTMLPFQNLFYLRQALDWIEKQSGLPERRG